VQTVEYKLRHFLPLDLPVSAFSADKAQQLYESEIIKISRFGRVMRAQTHRKLIGIAKTFFNWAVSRKYARANPFASVKPTGKGHAGKDQLRIDEARQLTQVLIDAATQGEEGAIATYTQLVLGLRSSEVLNRKVHDLDDEGRVLWIPSGKTDNARRRLEVPDVLRTLLLAQAQGKPAEQLLFGSDRTQPHCSPWLWRQLKIYCKRAGLRRVCPHSLRGLHSSLAVAAGCTSTMVASALGHGSFAITAKHYVDADTLRNSTVRRVSAALGREHTPVQLPTLIEQLRELPPQAVAALLRELSGEPA
jgi:integrase